MNKISNFLRRFFRRKPRPARHEYYAESSLPADAAELVRTGVVRPWRRDHFGEAWFVSDIGAVAWWQDSFGAET